jgi:hypothetical protein
MSHKLTLLLDDDVVAFGKDWAHRHGTSLSHVVEEYLAHLERAEQGSGRPPPKTSRLRGLLKGSGLDEADYKRHLEEKHA